MENFVVNPSSTVLYGTGQLSHGAQAAVDNSGRLIIVSGGVATSAVVPTYGTLAFGSVVAASYTTLVTNATTGLILTVDNKTDKDVLVSFDGTNPAFFVATGTGKIIDLGPAGKSIATNISVKGLADATSGNIYGTVFS